MRFIYSFLMYLLIPYMLLRLWWKGKRMPAYRHRILERFCLNKTGALKAVDIWIHAVSLGEVIAATPLIDALLDKHRSILVTTMTPSGSGQVQTRFADKVMHQYLPYDLPWVLKRFFKRFKPQMGILMETELWPNLIHQAAVRKLPLLLANARLSDRSLQAYVKWKFFFKPIVNQLTAILSQSEEDAKRFMHLGAEQELVQTIGNMKFDLQINKIDSKKYMQLRDLWGSERIVFIIASTHHNEESQIIAQLRRLQEAIPNLLVLIAPRHPERFQTVYQLCLDAGFKTGLRSQPESITPKTEIVILDCLGELLGFFQVSHYAFIGGSLVPVGGHNVLEPIAMNVPVVSGPHVYNFKTICNDLLKEKAIQLVKEANELVDAVIKLHEDKAFLSETTQNASLVLRRNKGSVQKHLQTIENYIGSGA